MSDPSTLAGAPEIPEDVLFRTYKFMLVGAGFEQPDLDDYRRAVVELISALRVNGWTICPPASDILRLENRDSPARTENTASVLAIDLDSEELRQR